MKAFRRARAIGLTVVVMAVVAGASFVGTNAVLGTYRPNARLIAVPSFMIDATVTALPSCALPPPTVLLYPGTQRCLTYTVHNPLAHAQMRVVSLSAVVDTTVPEPDSTVCPLNLSLANLSGTPGSPIMTVDPLSTNTASARIKLTDTGTDQSPTCEGVTYHFKLSGTADYSEVYSTGTVVTSSANPSNVGQSVTYTATVTASASTVPAQDAVPSSPTGTVTFYDGTVAPANIITGTNCNAGPMTSTGTTTATATCTPTPAYTSSGSHPITAVYSPDSPDGTANFSTSQGSMTQVVNANTCVSIATSGSGVTVITGSYNGNYTVATSQTLFLNGGTITGNVTVNAGGKFVTTGGTVKGNVQSSGPVSLQGTAVNGNVQATAPLALGANTVVGGNVQVSGSGVTTLCLSGNSSGPVKVGKDLQVQQLPTSSTQVTICNTQVSGNLQYTNNGTPVVLGGSAACRANTVGGNLQVQNNSARVTIGGSGFGNTAAGNIQVQNNGGGGTLAANASTGGNCQLQGNTPGIVGSHANTAHGQNTCNGTA